MKSSIKNLAAFLTIIGLGFNSCKKDISDTFSVDELTSQGQIVVPVTSTEGRISNRTQSEVQYNTFYGPVIQMGEGHVRSWVNISHDDKPLAIGIEFTPGVLQQQHDHTNGAGEHSHDGVLTLHQKAKAVTPFDHLTMGFMAAGHPPPGIYNVPHFDFHFYKMSVADRLAIPAYPMAMAAFNNNPPAGYLPPLYAKSPAGEAQMGAHWMDVTSPEFNGQPFTHTFIYGSYDGKVNFLEPMATLAFFESGATVQKIIRQPQFFDPSNTYYPTRYNIWKDEDNNRHYIALDQMVWR